MTLAELKFSMASRAEALVMLGAPDPDAAQDQWNRHLEGAVWHGANFRRGVVQTLGHFVKGVRMGIITSKNRERSTRTTSPLWPQRLL